MVFLLCSPWTLLSNEHIRIDIINSRLPKGVRDWIDVIGHVFGRKVVALELASERFYHLDTCLCPLSGGELLYYPPAFDSYGQQAILERVNEDRRLTVPEEEALKFACNAVCVGTRVALPEDCPATMHRLQERGYQVHPVPLDEFMKSGGSAKCLTLALD